MGLLLKWVEVSWHVDCWIFFRGHHFHELPHLVTLVLLGGVVVEKVFHWPLSYYCIRLNSISIKALASQ